MTLGCVKGRQKDKGLIFSCIKVEKQMTHFQLRSVFIERLLFLLNYQFK